MSKSAPKMVLAGGSGFLGSALAQWFKSLNWDVVILSRRPALRERCARIAAWDGEHLGDWQQELEGAQAVINLAGRSVNCRYHARNRDQIMNSRILPTRAMGAAIGQCRRPPQVWLNASTATIYKHSFDTEMDEATGPIGSTQCAKDAFSIEVAEAWERTLVQAETPRTRKVVLRIAMVFGRHPASVYRVLRRLARLRLGGPMAGGEQFVSWIHETDFCRSIEWLLHRDDMQGPINIAAPNPVTNREMMRLVRRSCGVGFGLPASRWMLEAGAALLRTETELVIKSRRVVPARLLQAGFDFCYPDLAQALDALAGRMPARGSRAALHRCRDAAGTAAVL